MTSNPLATLPARVASALLEQRPLPVAFIDLIVDAPKDVVTKMLGSHQNVGESPWETKAAKEDSLLARWFVAHHANLSDDDLETLMDKDLVGFARDEGELVISKASGYPSTPQRVFHHLYNKIILPNLNYSYPTHSQFYQVMERVCSSLNSPLGDRLDLLDYLANNEEDSYLIGNHIGDTLSSILRQGLLEEVLADPRMVNEKILKALAEETTTTTGASYLMKNVVPGKWLVEVLNLGGIKLVRGTGLLLDYVKEDEHSWVLDNLPPTSANLWHINECVTCQSHPKAIEAVLETRISSLMGSSWAISKASELLVQTGGENLTFWTVLGATSTQKDTRTLREILGVITDITTPVKG